MEKFLPVINKKIMQLVALEEEVLNLEKNKKYQETQPNNFASKIRMEFWRLLRGPEKTPEEIEAMKKKLVEEFKEFYSKGNNDDAFEYLNLHIEKEWPMGAKDSFKRLYGVDLTEELKELSNPDAVLPIPIFSLSETGVNYKVIITIVKKPETIKIAKEIVDKIAGSIL